MSKLSRGVTIRRSTVGRGVAGRSAVVAPMLAALIALSGVVAGTAAGASLGPAAQACAASAAHPAALVRIVGFKNRAGTVRVRAFRTDAAYLFDKRGAIARIEIPTPPTGEADICVPLPGPGAYAFDVRHDADGDGGTGMKDGGGMSGNPTFSFWQVITKHRPPVDKVAVTVRGGVAIVPIMLNYFQGGAFGPLPRTATR